MPQLTIPAATYEKLARWAAELNVTMEQLVTPALERIAGVEVENSHPPVPPAYDQWKAQFDEFLATAQSRAGRSLLGSMRMSAARASTKAAANEGRTRRERATSLGRSQRRSTP